MLLWHVTGLVNSYTELEMTVGHFPTKFRDLAEQIQFARTNLLHIYNGEANNSL